MKQENFLTEEELEEFEQQQTSTIRKIFRGAIAAVVLVGLIYISGVYQYFFFSRTSPDIQQEQTQTYLHEEVFMIPLTIFVIQNNEAFGSERTQEDVQRLVQQANRIWEQASITLEIQDVHMVSKTDQTIRLLYRDPHEFARELGGLESLSINVVMVQSLQGLNGVSFGGIPLVAVADYTTVYDFRVLAHEIGHRLGLGHVVDEKRLMHQGANGFELSLQEITTARGFAEQF
jgi:hypothetical protein